LIDYTLTCVSIKVDFNEWVMKCRLPDCRFCHTCMGSGINACNDPLEQACSDISIYVKMS
jgi:hypothetical protein